jgi:hypothetical protein
MEEERRAELSLCVPNLLGYAGIVKSDDRFYACCLCSGGAFVRVHFFNELCSGGSS